MKLSSLRPHPVVLQKMKSQQPLVPGGDPAGPAQMVKPRIYCSYTQTKLVDLANQFHQRPGKPLAAWLLHLWNSGVDFIMFTDNEMEKLAYITIHPSLCQPLQNSQQHGRGQGLHFPL